MPVRPRTPKKRADAAGRKTQGVSPGPAPIPNDAPAGSEAFRRLAETPVYRKLPQDVRAELDAALLLRHEGLSTVENAHQRLQLASRYGITLTEIRQYADALEDFARPIMAALAISALLRVLPRQLMGGFRRANRILVWSRLVQQLTDPQAEPLKAGEFARLAGLLQGEPMRRPRPAGSRPTRRAGSAAAGSTATLDQSVFSAVKSLYGINLSRDVAPQPDVQPDRSTGSLG